MLLLLLPSYIFYDCIQHNGNVSPKIHIKNVLHYTTVSHEVLNAIADVGELGLAL